MEVKIIQIQQKLWKFALSNKLVPVGFLSQATFNRITRLDMHCKID